MPDKKIAFIFHPKPLAILSSICKVQKLYCDIEISKRNYSFRNECSVYPGVK